MENADALDLSKENIQPLKRGRNTAQLGLALQAQSDPSLHQMFSKKQEWYEMQIRTYNGEDPLDLWCDYISWIEQSFPKHGPEGNLSLLLTKCFQAFKDEERYKNDPRFVGLWIKYIEMQTDSKRVELYQLLHTQGIGTTCADFYCSWAFEFQSVNDWKQADQIFKKGLSKMAQPIQTLEAAHQQFLASYVFSHRSNGDAPDEEENHVQSDHRLPMAALKPVGKKSAAPNVRVGSNVRSQLPGVLPAMQGSSGRSGSSSSSRTFGVRGNNAGPVAVYQEHGEPEVEATHSQAVSSALPITQSLNKENLVRAGPWTGQGLGSRKQQSTSLAHPYVARQPAFEVHKDEDAIVGNGQEMRPHSTTVISALQPRKALEDGFQDAIAIFEEPNPYSVPMYRKNQIYAGGKEFQLEELHALDYFRMKAEKEHKIKESPIHPDQSALYHKKLIPIEEGMHQDVQCSGSYGNGHMNVGDFLDHSSVNKQPSSSERLSVDFVSTSSSNNYLTPQPPSAYGVPTSAEAEVVHHMDHNEQPPIGQRSSNQSMHNHSMTLHTKLAMREVNNYWGSPSIVKSPTIIRDPISEEVYHHPTSSFQTMKDDALSLSTKPEMSVYCDNVSFSNQELIDTTSYTNGFQIYQEPQYQAPVEPQSQKFAVFCDDSDNDIGPARTLSMEKGEHSSTYTSGSLMHKVAKEKENIHKFPIADMELMEDCGVAPVPDVTLHQPEFNDYGDYSHMQNPPEIYSQQPVSMASHDMLPVPHSHDSRQPAPAPVASHVLTQLTPVSSSHSMMHSVAPQPVSSSDAAHGMLLPPAPTHGLVQPGPTLNQVYQEPMEDDMVASAPQFGVNMSETGITEAFFFPQMGAVSTPFKVSPKKSKASKSSIDFNSSLYRVEQSWPDEEENGAQGFNRSPDAPKTVPPLKLFRIKNDSDQLSAIVETSREQCQSAFSNNMSSLATNSRYGMYSTQRNSIGPTPYLNQINESLDPYQEPYSQEQVLTEVQPQVQNQPQVPSRELDPEQMVEMARRLEKGEINPFDSRLLKFFLARMEFPLPHHSDGYHVVNGAVPAQRNKSLNLNGEVYTVAKVLGEGAYAKVLKGVHTVTQKEVALKVQKPCCRWEYYICREIQHRLSQKDLASAFMPADHIYVYNNGSVIVTDLLAYGTLLNLVNKVFASTKRQMTELQVLYLLDQLLSAVGALHKCRIIHGDLKPDNILIRSIPGSGAGPCIQFIDFGRSIDMSLMPDGATFDTVVMTDTFTCIEMRTGKPWTYQTDLFGLANTTHCLLFGDYMKVQESRSTGRWTIQSRLPRHVNAEFWTPFFDTLLNIESCDSLPDLELIRSDAQSRMNNSGSQLSMTVSALGRLLLSR